MNIDIDDLIEILQDLKKKKTSGGCGDCVFFDGEEWEQPCVECKRSHKDYWRCKQWND